MNSMALLAPIGCLLSLGTDFTEYSARPAWPLSVQLLTLPGVDAICSLRPVPGNSRETRYSFVPATPSQVNSGPSVVGLIESSFIGAYFAAWGLSALAPLLAAAAGAASPGKYSTALLSGFNAGPALVAASTEYHA
jgi:hypothetical protein